MIPKEEMQACATEIDKCCQLRPQSLHGGGLVAWEINDEPFCSNSLNKLCG
jgi:hypothetical protein